MDLKKLLDKLTDELEEQMAAVAAPATQTADVPGVPKPLGIVRRKYPGYEEDRKKGKKRKHISHVNEAGEGADGAGPGPADADVASTFSMGGLGKKAWDGDRPKYKPKKKFFARPEKQVKKRVHVKEDWEPFKQSPPEVDIEFVRKTFAGMRPDYKPKKVEITGKKKKKRAVQEQFMGPQIFNDSSPYKDVEYLTKFWRGSKAGNPAEPERKPKKKHKSKKPIGTYGIKKADNGESPLGGPDAF